MNPSDTHEQRFERWLLVLHTHLQTQGYASRLFYDDRPLGDRLVNAVDIDGQLTELHVHRDGRGAQLLLVSEGRNAIARQSAAIDKLHRRIPRRHNAKRRFLHRVETLASHLAASYQRRAALFPVAEFADLHRGYGYSKPMIGATARFRVNHHEPGAVSVIADGAASADDEHPTRAYQRQLRRYPSVFAASVIAAGVTRAALFRDNDFYIGDLPLIASTARESHGDAVVDSMVEYDPATTFDYHHSEIAGPSEIDASLISSDGDATLTVGADGSGADSGGDSFGGGGDSFGDGGGLDGGGGSWADAGAGSGTDSGDCGGCDLPDCDLPDCGGCDLPDCGGCDLPSC